MAKTKLLAFGKYLTSKVIKNTDLFKNIESTDEWIKSRTGIEERRIADPEIDGDLTSVGFKAAKAALHNAKLDPEDIDAIICATFSPDYFFPSTACRIQGLIGAKNAFAFDISAACSGFIYGLSVADSLIKSNKCKYVLLIGAEIASRALDWSDRTTSILFGDAAGACILGRTMGQSCISSINLESFGDMSELLKLPAWGESRYIQMDGREIFKHAVSKMSSSIQKSLDDSGLSIKDIDLIIPHQANHRIIQALAEKLKLNESKVYCNIQKLGNTSAASIPIAIDEAIRNGSLKKNMLIGLVAFGGGLTVGSAIAKY